MHRTAARIASASLLLLSVACTRELDLPQPLPDTGAISGKAVAEVPGSDQVEAVQGAYISIPGTNLHSLSDQQGAFTIGPLPPGTYKVLVELRGTADQSRQRLLEGVVVDRGATKGLGNIPLRRNAVLTGRVSISGQSRGNQGITVFVPGTDFVSATADTGSWRLSNLPEGPVSVGAFRPGFTASFTSPITAQGGLLTTAVDLVIEPEAANPQPGAIKGTVKVVGRTPDGVTVTAWKGGATTPAATATATTDANGAFLLSNLAVDLYRLEAKLSGFSTLVVSNLLITSGTPLTLPEALVLVAPGEDNVPPPPPVDAGTPDAGVDAGPDAGTDGGAPDAGGISAQCNSDNDCASGRLCISGRCQGCLSSSDCQPGYLCQAGDCVRACASNSECPSGLVCSNGICGACVASADCRDPSLVCLPGGSCGHCRSGADCPSGKACLANGCGGCTTDGECGAGRLCEQGACIPGNCHDGSGCSATQACVNKSCTTCSADSQCAAGRLCLGSACQVANCRQSGECAAGQVCANNLCGACGGAAQCAAGQVCDQGVCAAGDCTSDAQCTGGQICSNHQCSPCASSAQCGAGRVCAGQACVAGDCLSSATCAAGQVCKGNHCQACSVSADCAASGLVCDTGACVAGDCLSRTNCIGASAGKVCKADHCSLCNTINDCTAGEVCTLAGLCKAGDCAVATDCLGAKAGMICTANTCSACSGDADCGQGRLCLGAGAAARCTAASCRTNGDCPSAQACVGNQCTSCGSSGDCRTGQVCAAQKCVTGNCLSEAACNAGQLCLNNTCAGCAANADCGSGRVCVANLCTAGDCVNAASDCAVGQVCLGHHCQACARTADCGQSGVVCDTGVCTPGNCVTRADCTVANGAVLGQVCKSHHCTTCASTADCGSGEVCNVSGLCEPGNCATTADCTGTNAGKVCLASGGGHLCQLCSTDAQCGAPASGQICGLASLCVTGNCHADTDCAAGGQRLCLANASGGKSCQACTATSPVATQGGCATGYLCDASGFCQFGKCISGSDCGGGQICVGHQCAGCTALTESQCPVTAPICNTTTGACTVGNCHKDTDCTAPNYTGGAGVCVNYSCIGNCRSNADCNASGTSPYCNLGTHQCSPCTSSGQCTSGSVCTSASGGSCVVGNCAFDIACNAAAGLSCVSNTCTQTAPGSGATLPGGGSPVTAAGAPANSGSFPAVLSGNLGLYYSYVPTSAPTNSVATAVDAADLKHVRWAVQDGTNYSGGFAGFVMPAPGFPAAAGGATNDLFFTSDYFNFYAHLGSDGTVMWKQPQPWYGPGALGIAGSGSAGVPTMAFYTQSAGTPTLVRADTGATRTVNINGCSTWGTPLWGKFYVYYFCWEGVAAIDPVANVVKWKLPFPGGYGGGNGGGSSSPAIWRPQGATQETLYFATSVNNAATREWMLTVTDAMVASGTAPSGYIQGPLVLTNSSYSATLLDADSTGLGGAAPPRVIFTTTNTASVTDGIGTLLAQVTTPFTTNRVTLSSDGTLVGVNDASASNGLLTGIQIAPNAATPASAQVTTKWTLPLSPAGSWSTLTYPTAVGTPGATLGNLLAWGSPGSSNPVLYELAPPSGGASFLASAPSWSWYGGDAGGHRMAPGLECSTSSDCSVPTQSCLLGRCIGTCRTSADCGLATGLGCVLAQCEPCLSDQSCDATRSQKCSAGICYDPPATGTACGSNADCKVAGQSCIHAACVPTPALAANVQSALTFTPSAAFAGDSHGNVYSVWSNGTVQSIRAWDPATFDGSSTWLGTVSNFGPLSATFGNTSLPPYPTIVTLNPDRDTIFLTGASSSYPTTTVTALDGLPLGNASTSTSRTLYDGRTSSTRVISGGLAQGVSKAGDGTTPKLALFSYDSAGYIYGFDAQSAATSTGNLTVLWSGLTGGSDTFNNQPVPLLVGSDGTVYHFRGNGTIQAWSPDGDASGTIVGGTKAGKLLWTFSPANLTPAQPVWTNNVGLRPAIASTGGQDTLYFCSNVATTLTMLDVSAAGFGTYTTTSASCGPSNTVNSSLLVDTDGTAFVPATTGISVVAGRDLAGLGTRGTVLSSLSVTVGSDGAGVTLGDDGVLYYAAYVPSTYSYILTAAQVSPTKQLSVLWQLLGENNSWLDAYGVPALLPGAGATGPGHLLIDYYVSGSSGPRVLSSYSLGATHALKPGAWSVQGGDLLHRNSLKTQ